MPELGGGAALGSGAEPHKGLGRSGETLGPAVLVQEGLAEEMSWQQSAGAGVGVCVALGQSPGSPWSMCSEIGAWPPAGTDVQELPTAEEMLLPGFLLMYGEQGLLRHPKLSFLCHLPAQILSRVGELTP